MPDSRDILHVDMDAFFASVEQVLDPSLRGKAVIVGGAIDDRSVVSAASYEARKFGVHSAMPIARARRLCPHAVFLRGNFQAYGEFSDRTKDILFRFTPLVERVSLDDFYLDLTGCRRLHGPPLQAAEKLRQSVLAETGLSVSIGIAANKLVAKVGSDYAKPKGIVEIWRGYEAAFLRYMPIEKLPGVGPRTKETLRRFNLLTIGALADISREFMEQRFGAGGVALWEHAHGRADVEVIADRGLPKSISRETTLKQDTDDRDVVRGALYSLVERAARQLREQGLTARRVTVKLRYADFKTVSRACTLKAPTEQDNVFYEAALAQVERLMGRRLRVRLVGVSLSGLTLGTARQGDLFADQALERRTRLYRGLDQLRDRFGFDIARTGPPLRELREEEDGGSEE